MRSRHTARSADAEGERQLAGSFGEGDDAGYAKDIRDLVGIRGNCRRSVRQHRADELVDPELGGLKVHVSVHEPRRKSRTAHVDDLAGFSRAPTGDGLVRDRKICRDPLPRARDEHAAACYEKVSRLVTASYC